MKQSILMRVLVCKIHCPSFMCFCKPSVGHLYNPGPLKLENAQCVPSTSVPVNDSSDQICNEGSEFEEESGDGNGGGLKSCIRKGSTELQPGAVQKKKVQWMDNFGKELVEIKEFESSDTINNDYEQESTGCICVIV